jgi:hypothetical protein
VSLITREQADLLGSDAFLGSFKSVELKDGILAALGNADHGSLVNIDLGSATGATVTALRRYTTDADTATALANQLERDQAIGKG